jgi:hypothetical protein
LNKDGWTLGNKLSAIAIIFSLIFSIVSMVYTGLAYSSNEAGKRGDLNFYVEGSEFAIDPYNISDSFNYALGFRLTGAVINEGARSLQIESCELTITLPISPSLRELNNYSSNILFMTNGHTIISNEENHIDWTNRIIEPNQQKNLNYTNWGMYDSFYSTLNPQDIKASLEIKFDDGKGIQFKEIEVTQWLQVDPVFLRI